MRSSRREISARSFCMSTLVGAGRCGGAANGADAAGAGGHEAKQDHPMERADATAAQHMLEQAARAQTVPTRQMGLRDAARALLLARALVRARSSRER